MDLHFLLKEHIDKLESICGVIRTFRDAFIDNEFVLSYVGQGIKILEEYSNSCLDDIKDLVENNMVSF